MEDRLPQKTFPKLGGASCAIALMGLLWATSLYFRGLTIYHAHPGKDIDAIGHQAFADIESGSLVIIPVAVLSGVVALSGVLLSKGKETTAWLGLVLTGALFFSFVGVYPI